MEKDAFNGARKKTLWLKKLQLRLGQDGWIPEDVAERDFWRDERLATTELVAKDSAQVEVEDGLCLPIVFEVFVNNVAYPTARRTEPRKKGPHDQDTVRCITEKFHIPTAGVGGGTAL